MTRMVRWIVGASLVAVGIVLLFVPLLPGIPLVVAGLALLSVQIAARRQAPDAPMVAT